MTDITWAPIIPLIGGFSLGAEKATERPPEFIASYDGFWPNDSHYVNYQNNTLKRNIDYRVITESRVKDQKVNIIVGTPPCAALSQLNTGKSAAVKGSGCAKNEWMYEVFHDGICKYDADVVMIENAPALYTEKGLGVAEALYDITKQYNYSLTLYKTNTKYHGVPQSRERTFAFAWKSRTAPILNYYDRKRKNFREYLNEVKDGDLQQDIVVNPKVASEGYYSFIKEKYHPNNPRKIILQRCNTAHNYVKLNDMLDEFVEWAKKTGHENGIKHGTHAVKKFNEGKGIWDGSVHVFNDVMNAVIGRNMADTIHPDYDRSLTIREALHMMAFPSDFELVGGRSKLNHIAQNVPACTARDMVFEAIKFIRGELEMSDQDFIKQNNHKKLVENLSSKFSSLEAFVA